MAASALVGDLNEGQMRLMQIEGAEAEGAFCDVLTARSSERPEEIRSRL